jgi:hypothetical protein
LFSMNWMYFSPRFPRVTGIALKRVKGRQLASYFLVSNGYRRNPLVLLWWNSCISLLPITSKATSATFVKAASGHFKPAGANISRSPKKTRIGKHLEWLFKNFKVLVKNKERITIF